MSSPHTPARQTAHRTNWAAVGGAFAVWTLLALVSIFEPASMMRSRGEPVPWAWIVPSQVIEWYGNALASLTLVWMVRRYPAGVTRLIKALPVYAAGLSVAILAKIVIVVALKPLLPAAGAQRGVLMIRQEIAEGIVVFAIVITVLNVMELQRRLKDREQVALALRAQLSEAELALLKGQLQPHFLFNTLNGVASLIHTAPDKADRVVVQLADLLRASLDSADEREIPLSAELALADKYIAIMEARFEGKLSVLRDIDPSLLGARVPQFILQPLIENAFEHGIARSGGTGRVTIRAIREGGARLRLEVIDDGAGVDPVRGDAGSGVGLTNTRLRLERLYGEGQSLTLSAPPQGGATAVVVLPLRTE